MEENEKKEIGKAEKKEGAIETLTEGKTFVSDSFGNLRTAVDNYGRPVFCLKDACAILEIKNPSDASKRLRKSGVVRLKANDGKKNNSFLYITFHLSPRLCVIRIENKLYKVCSKLRVSYLLPFWSENKVHYGTFYSVRWSCVQIEKSLLYRLYIKRKFYPIMCNCHTYLNVFI